MRRDLIGHGPHVNLLKDVDARDDKEDARTSSSSGEEATKAEDHRTLVFLHSVKNIGERTSKRHQGRR